MKKFIGCRARREETDEFIHHMMLWASWSLFRTANTPSGVYYFVRRIIMKYLLGVLLIMLAMAFLGLLLPAIIGIVIGVFMIQGGSVIGGLIAMAVGIGINAAMVLGGFAESGSSSSHIDDECPYSGSGDTDGNHCYTCDDDF